MAVLSPWQTKRKAPVRYTSLSSYPGGPAGGAYGNPMGTAPSTTMPSGGRTPSGMDQYLEGGGTGLRVAPEFDATRAAGGGSIFVGGGEPAYRGILDRYTADMRARINAGAGAMQAQRLGSARGLINKLGVRDPSAMMGQVGKFGLTLEDLQAAADNPWSELRGIDQFARTQRGGMIADRAQRGGIRSGGSARGVRMIEQERAKNEAQASQAALQALADQEFSARDWERQQWDDFNQRSFDLEQQLAQQYQPVEAVWDAANSGYRYGNKVYDQSGNLIRTL